MNYQMVEYAVRRYIDAKHCLDTQDYCISIKSSGYILGSFFAFVVTDNPNDDRIYEVTHLDVSPKSTVVTSYIHTDEDLFFI